MVPKAVDGSEQEPYFFPLKVALLSKDTNELREKTLIISKKSEEFIFEGFENEPVLSVNRDFSAPIIVEQESNDFAYLMKHDTNSFVRYESAQSFGVETIEAIMRGEAINEAFVEAYGYLLDLEIDFSYKALLLELPSISTLMQRQEVVDFEEIYKAKDSLAERLAIKYANKLLSIYKTNHEPKSTSLDSLSMAKRSIKNRVLRTLSAFETDEVIALAKLQYEESSTMTDRVAALDILENSKSDYTKLAFADFYEKYKNDMLTMTKYFSLLCASNREGTLSRVIELQEDEAYDEKVPNLVRSLVGAFARNYKHFHAKDGSGYKFVADKIIEIDKINAQMASGLAGVFKIYNRMNKRNKNLMKAELERVISTQSLSKNSFEIISKILVKD